MADCHAELPGPWLTGNSGLGRLALPLVKNAYGQYLPGFLKEPGVLMQITPTAIPGVLVIKPTVDCDDGGFFFESFKVRSFKRLISVEPPVMQDDF